MAWTAPMTFVANSVLTAAQLNTHVRDNLNETAPAKATTAGYHFVTVTTNQIAERAILSANTETAETTTGTGFGDLATVGPTVTITTGTQALVWVGCTIANSGTSGGAMGFEISGATSDSATDSRSYGYEGSAGDAGRGMWVDKITLTAGSNVFTAKYRVAGGTGTFTHRRIGVMAL